VNWNLSDQCNTHFHPKCADLLREKAQFAVHACACVVLTRSAPVAKRKVMLGLRLNYIDSPALRQSLLLKQIGLFANRVCVCVRGTNTHTCSALAAMPAF
jgi:hypothetical protein